MLNPHGYYSFWNHEAAKKLSDYYNSYDDMLNGNDAVTVAGIDFDAADVLYNLDPTAYREGFNDYINTLMLDEERAELRSLFLNIIAPTHACKSSPIQ